MNMSLSTANGQVSREFTGKIDHFLLSLGSRNCFSWRCPHLKKGKKDKKQEMQAK